MAKRKKEDLPKLKKNKKGEFFINWKSKKIYMGRNPKDAREKLVRFLADCENKNIAAEKSIQTPIHVEKNQTTVAQLILQYLKYLEKIKFGNFYRAKIALKRTNEKFGDELVQDFGPRALHLLRDSWVEDGLSWEYVKNLEQIVRNMFRFGLEYELVDDSTCGRLALVRPIQKGEAKVNPPRLDVPDAEIKKTLPHLLPTLRDIVVLQRLTGMRPSEVFGMTMAQIDTTQEDAWIYVPDEYKTKHFGKERVIALGRLEISILERRAAGKEKTEILFSPRDSVKEKWERDHPGKVPDVSRFQKMYNKDSYRQAIQRAIERANKIAETENNPENRVQSWTPYQLRHASATFISLLFDETQAAIQLGHASTATTRRYDHSAAEKAVQLVKRRDAQCAETLESFLNIRGENEE